MESLYAKKINQINYVQFQPLYILLWIYILPVKIQFCLYILIRKELIFFRSNKYLNDVFWKKYSYKVNPVIC